MLLTDTDGLMCKIEAENVFGDSGKNKELFDLSNYPEYSEYYNNANNLFINKTKDETCGVPMTGFVGLKSKIYTFIAEENHESKKPKDINKKFVDDKLKKEDYKTALFNRSYMSDLIIKLLIFLVFFR